MHVLISRICYEIGGAPNRIRVERTQAGYGSAAVLNYQPSKFVPRRSLFASDLRLLPAGSEGRKKSPHFPVQHAGRFSRKAEMPSCASAAMEFMVMISLAYAYALGWSRSICV